MEHIIVFANQPESAVALTAGAKSMGAQVALITSESVYGSADSVFLYASELSVSEILPDIAKLVRDAQANLFLCEASRDGKLVAGYTAAVMGVSPLCDVSSLRLDGDIIETTRLVYGGSAVQTERCPLPAVITAGPGILEAEAVEAPNTVSPLAVSQNTSIMLDGISPMEASSTNLAGAKRVVGVGRGLSSPDNLPLVEQLAAALGAEIGCTRPAAEEEHWFTKDRYIGVSGCMLKPNFYLAIGISGQIQHMVGVNQANVIFAIDKNENAPIFQQADHGLVGDVNTVLPAIIELLK